LFLAYLDKEEPPRNEAVGWLEQHFDASSETTRDRYLSFLRGLELIDGSGGRLTPGQLGRRYLETESPETLYAILDAGVAGFDLMVEALATRGSLSDEELRTVLNRGPYGHDMEGTGVAIRHREWLQALDYVERVTDSTDTNQNRLTPAGYDLWNQFEEGDIARVPTDEASRQTTKLRLIPEDPVPDLDFEKQPEMPTESKDHMAREFPTEQRRATIEHQEVVAWLRDMLKDSGYEVMKTQYSDVIAYTDFQSDILLFEVKSITPDNVWEQVRKAVGQVIEYEFTDIISRDELQGAIHPTICLSQEPSKEIQDYLEHLVSTRGILVIWPTDNEQSIGGPSNQTVSKELLSNKNGA
jgi:hypothetical protein